MMVSKTLGELASELNCDFVGDASISIRRVVHPLEAANEHDLSLILDDKILPLLAQKPVKTALVPKSLNIKEIPNQIKIDRPKVALARLLEIFDTPAYVADGVHPSSVIDPDAVVEAGVSIGPLCTVGPKAFIGKGTRLVSHVQVGANVSIGENCLIHAGVRIGDRVQIGNRVILQPNAVIGSDGYSYVTPEAGSVETAKSTGKIEAFNTAIIKINSIGRVVIEDDVEIGANCCIDRATLGETRIKKGTKLDNLVQVAHNVTIGENCLIVSQAGIAGSSKIGNRSVIGGQVGIKDHTSIGEDCIILSQSGVIQDVPDRSIVMGSPAMPRKEFLYREMQIKRLKGLNQKIEAISRQVEQLISESKEEALEQVL